EAESPSLQEPALLLPTDPLLAARPALFLPDRDGLFESVDDGAARLERFASMGGGAGNDDRGLADFQQAEAVGDSGGNVWKSYIDIIHNHRDFFFSHRPV